eukprot:maker-scaffold_24-snap-gene-1.27-mRNA-1 protein AED:0.26 eAED:0.26 QI:52/1/1/1/1/1/2/374/263
MIKNKEIPVYKLIEECFQALGMAKENIRENENLIQTIETMNPGVFQPNLAELRSVSQGSLMPKSILPAQGDTFSFISSHNFQADQETARKLIEKISEHIVHNPKAIEHASRENLEFLLDSLETQFDEDYLQIGDPRTRKSVRSALRKQLTKQFEPKENEKKENIEVRKENSVFPAIKHVPKSSAVKHQLNLITKKKKEANLRKLVLERKKSQNKNQMRQDEKIKLSKDRDFCDLRKKKFKEIQAYVKNLESKKTKKRNQISSA